MSYPRYRLLKSFQYCYLNINIADDLVCIVDLRRKKHLLYQLYIYPYCYVTRLMLWTSGKSGTTLLTIFGRVTNEPHQKNPYHNYLSQLRNETPQA